MSLNSAFYENADPLLLAVDCIIFGYTPEGLKLLLFKRRVEPFAGAWSLIGSFVQRDESVEEATSRILEEATGLSHIFQEELGVFSSVNRDPGGRVISIAYYALVRIQEEDADLLALHQASWFPVDQRPPLILDHEAMVVAGLDKLRRKARYQPLGFELLPEKFTIPQLRSFYEAILQREVDQGNFRKKILAMGILEKLAEKDRASSKKGAHYYRFDRDQYDRQVQEGFDFTI
ncbi:MAG: NUDIX hydrolase [Lewinellaceae bacterium]|nr:NUDIX hydrolase [Lewinellaceae bacterium]